MALRPDERHLAGAIAAFATEHGMPKRVTFGGLAVDYGAVQAAIAVGRVWCIANWAISEVLLERGIVVRRDANGLLSMTAA